jgi:thiamine-monophosphate kinase
LLARLGRYLAREGGELVTAAGDDAAVWQPPLGRAVVTTTDSLVEGVHFSLPLSVTGAVDLGWRLLAVSLSDIAAMGAVPGPAFIAISVPGAWPVAWVEGIYQGIAECAAGFDVPVAGGNISASPAAVLTSTCLGSVDSQHHLLRNGAAAGDQLAVTGPLGAAAATLRADALTGEGPGQWAAAARPSPRVEAGQVLVACGVHQALDISDGLFVDTGRLLQLADCPGLLIDAAQVPAAPGVRERWPREWLGVVGGGEDYELAFAAPPAVMQRAMRALGAAGLAPAIIGRFDHGEGLRVMLDGEEVPPPESGHQHFQA